MATIRFGNQPHGCSKSGLSHDNPLILFPSLAFALFLTFPFHVSVTFLLSACQKPSASGVAVLTSIWRRHIMILSLRSHLFSHHVLIVSQVNCIHYSSAVCMIYLYRMSTWCVFNACSQSFLSMIFTHIALFRLLPIAHSTSLSWSLSLPALVLCSFSSGPLFLSGPLNGWQKSPVCEWVFGWLALLMVCAEADR